MKSVDCDIIKDLLPSYIDGVSSEATNKLIKKHLETCKNCCLTLKEMKEETNTEIIEGQEEQIDYLKGYRKNKIRTIIFAILMTIIIIIVAFIADIYFAETYSKIEMPAEIDEINVEYMYTRNWFGHNTLDIFFYSDKYKNLTGEYINREDGSKEIYFKISSINRIKSIFGNKNYYSNQSGLRYSFDIEEINRMYITDGKGIFKEIWNKDMEVMTLNEWKKWYIDSYAPQEVFDKKIMNKEIFEMPDIVYDNTEVWRHLYTPKGK